MAKHEFGIMQDAPKQGKRYDEYEPQKYHCISVNDVYLDDVIANFDKIDFYWHTLEVHRKGLAYCGVTLIPSSSLPSFIDGITDISALSELKELSKKALKGNKWMIHFVL